MCSPQDLENEVFTRLNIVVKNILVYKREDVNKLVELNKWGGMQNVEEKIKKIKQSIIIRWRSTRDQRLTNVTFQHMGQQLKWNMNEFDNINR